MEVVPEATEAPTETEKTAEVATEVPEALTKAEKRVKLKSFNDEMFEVDEAEAFESQAVKNILKDAGIDVPTPFPNISSKSLAKVIIDEEKKVTHVEQLFNPTTSGLVPILNDEFNLGSGHIALKMLKEAAGVAQEKAG